MTRKFTPEYVPTYMDYAQVAKYLGVQPSTIRTWTRENKIPYIRMSGLVRYARRAIDDWMREKETIV